MLKVIIQALCLFGVIMLAFTVYDLMDAFRTWVSRIGIGKWHGDLSKWREAVERKATRWLKHTPRIPKSDNRRFILLDILKGNRYSGTIQSWQVAALVLGLEQSVLRRYLDKDRSIIGLFDKEIDSALLAYALFTKDMLPETLKNSLYSHFSQFTSGTVEYRRSLPGLRYVDSIGFLCPLLYSIGLDDLADRQIREFDPVLFDGCFPPHALDLGSSIPLGVYDWSRGLGWYVLGLLGSDRNLERIVKLAEKVIPFQKKDGSFGCFLFNPHSRKESSGTVMMGHLFVAAYKYKADPAFLDAAFAVEKALMSMTRRDGGIDFAQGDTKGIGIYSTHFDIMPFVQGMALSLSKQLDPFR